MKCLVFVFGVLFISTHSFAQSKEELENWVYSVENEFPEIEKSTTSSKIGSGSPKYNKIRFNLLSDSYFIPVFGKAFDQLSALKRKSIASKIRSFKNKKQGKFNIKYPWAKRLDWYMWGVFTQAAPYEDASKAVAEIRNTKQKFNSLIQKINDGGITFEAIASEKSMAEKNYAMLLPSEIATLNTLIDGKAINIANTTLVAKAKELSGLDATFSSLQKIKAFRQENQTIYQSASRETSKMIDDQNEVLTNRILDHLVKKETENLNLLNITELNNFRKNFFSKYHDWDSYSYKQVKGVNDIIETVKIKKVTDQLQDINSKIASAQSDKDLFNIEQLYLSFIHQSKEIEVVKLNKTIADRKVAIVQEKNQRLQEETRQKIIAEAEAIKRYGFKFSTAGLSNPDLINFFFKGDFLNIPFNRDELAFGGMLKSYMYAYAKSCNSSLPSNKVQIYEKVCVEETITKDGYGMQVDSYCSRYENRPTGLFATPELHNAYINNQSMLSGDALKHIGAMMQGVTKENGLQNITNKAFSIVALQTDMEKLITANGCNNNALKRFEENLILFAYNAQPKRLDETNPVKQVDYSREQNLKFLVDDLVSKNAESWAMNQLVSHSFENVQVISRDSNNYPAKMQANYKFQGIFGNQIGKVSITFKNGLPDCLYFSDNPNICRTADRKIVKQFIDGKYIIN